MTPQEIKDMTFTKAVFGGYDMGGVEDFVDKVAEDYEALFKENAILKSKLKVLVEKVEEYRNTEDAMRMALLSAKKMADEMIEEAKKKAESMLRTTESGISSKISAMQKQVEDEERRLKAAQKVTAEFVDMSMSLCKKHVNFLQKLGELNESELEEERPAPAPKAEKTAEAARESEDSATRVYGSLQEDIKIAETKITRPKLPEGWEDDEEPAEKNSKSGFGELKSGYNFNEEQ